MHPAFPPDPSPLEVDLVEWVPASAEGVRVHLHGRWSDRPAPSQSTLLLSDGSRRHGFDALAEAPPGVLLAFEVPNELRRSLEGDLALQVGSSEIALPAATPGALEQAGEGPAGEVIDRAVLAERRARRAELSEDAVSRRADAAEQTSATLSVQLANLEQRLALVGDERAEIEGQLAQSERRLRAAEQREHAEQQLRIEAQDDLGLVRRAHEAEIADLRARLESATRRAEELARDVERARRAAAEARQRAEADLNAARRAEPPVAAGQSDDAANRLRAEAERLGSELAEERAARERVTRLLDESRAAAQSELKRLEYELGARRDVHGGILAELAAAQAELLRLRGHGAASAPLTARAAQPLDAVLEQRVAALEQRREVAEHDTSLMREVLDARSHELDQARLELRQQLVDVVAALRDAAEGDRASRIELERELLARERREAELQSLVAEVLRTSASLRTRFEAEIRELEKRMTDRLLSERAEAAEKLEAAKRLIADLEARVLTADDVRSGRDLTLGLRAEAESLRSELARVRALAERQGDSPREANAMIGGLEAAASRLREQVAAPTDEADPEAPIAQRLSEPRDTRRLSEPPAPLAPRTVDTARPPARWLAPAIAHVSRTDPAVGARLVVGLMPALRPKGVQVAFDLTVDGGGSHRVTIGPDATIVEAIDGPSPRGVVEFRLSGPPQAFAGFVGGGMRRRPKELRVAGSRRRLRKLVRRLQQPLRLADVQASGARVDPGLLLAALAANIGPHWTVGRRFTVAWKVSGEHAGSWYADVYPGRVPTIATGLPEQPATATVYVTEGALIPLLAGLELPAGDAASVVGDAAPVTLLREWFDRAQGLG